MHDVGLLNGDGVTAEKIGLLGPCQPVQVIQ